MSKSNMVVLSEPDRAALAANLAEHGPVATARKSRVTAGTVFRAVDGRPVQRRVAGLLSNSLKAGTDDVNPKSLDLRDPETRATLEKMSEQLSKLERCYAELAEFLRASRPAQAA